jgi:CRISPR type I-E-associated protein CasB/Cse2
MNPNNAFAWWRQLQPSHPDGSKNHVGDAGALARLRRGGLRDVMLQPETVALYYRLDCERPWQLTNVALCAGVLAHVNSHAGEQTTARMFANAGLNQARFRRLLTADDAEERLTELRRALAIAEGAANVFDLSRACLAWSDAMLRRWSLDYYGAVSATA